MKEAVCVIGGLLAGLAAGVVIGFVLQMPIWELAFRCGLGDVLCDIVGLFSFFPPFPPPPPP